MITLTEQQLVEIVRANVENHRRHHARAQLWGTIIGVAAIFVIFTSIPLLRWLTS